MCDFKGKKVLVLGLARSGSAVARLLLRRGASVVISDLNQDEATLCIADELIALGACATLGEHPFALLDHVDLVVKNPGIRYSVPLLVEAARRGVRIVTEIEVAGSCTDSPIMAITGSNGKTTTTTMIGEMFTGSPQRAEVVGNIGKAMSGAIDQTGRNTWLVTEVSSFQLQGTERFHPQVAVLLNAYPTHLDYHGSFDAYFQAKLRIFANQTSGDVAVLNFDKDNLRELISPLRARGVDVQGFSLRTPVANGLFVSGSDIVQRGGDGSADTRVCRVDEIALPGEFNLENALAAGTAALAAGVPLARVVAVWRTFKGVEHRLEWVRSVNGVKFYNDSKATNPQATIRAIASFAEPEVVILGGLERGDDLTPLREPLRKHARAVVVLGESAKRMQRVAAEAGIAAVKVVETIEEAVVAAAEFARPGDVVLLSPAAASWDMFPSFEVRGSMFKQAVHML